MDISQVVADRAVSNRPMTSLDNWDVDGDDRGRLGSKGFFGKTGKPHNTPPLRSGQGRACGCRMDHI